MASATKKKAPTTKAATRPGPKVAAKKAKGRPTPTDAQRQLAGIEEPDRSAPPLAEVDADVLEFIDALDRFKKQNGRPFPSWSEVLLVLRQLGYSRK